MQAKMILLSSSATLRRMNNSFIRARRFCSADSSVAGTIEYDRIHHVGLVVRDTEASKQFYMSVLGMLDVTPQGKEKLPFDAVFLRAGQSQFHLMKGSNPDESQTGHGHNTQDRHVAVTIKSLNPLIKSFENNGWSFAFGRGRRRTIFTHDLDSNLLEFTEHIDS